MRRYASFYINRVFSGALIFGALLIVPVVKGDDGYRLWLRYDQLPARSAQLYRERIKSISVEGNSATFAAIRNELRLGCSGLLGTSVDVDETSDAASVVIGLPASAALIRKLRWDADLKKLGPEGFRIRTIAGSIRPVIVIAATTDVGALYGAFHFLRL